MTKSDRNPSSNVDSVIAAHSYRGRDDSISGIARFAEDRNIPTASAIWDAMNFRLVRTVKVWRERLQRQRQHSIDLENLLAEKNSYICELREENRLKQEKLDHVLSQIERYEAI